ncbi:hypothetical protein C2845_PM06G01730 [Panicum miliaceum]|uniref:Uncharacterized protein n=1 Tax=Panicum miliaceum TaxID=4540 RepID=A0A3L6R5H1_PANMI|nr:hypothetical protein C2845_PM06G01730 [Panicum miliaceum]
MKQACHVSTSVSTTTQYRAAEPFQRASSPSRPPFVAIPIAATSEAMACITACTSTSM